MTRGPINITSAFEDDRGSADRIAAAFPGVDFFEPSRFHTETYEVIPLIYEGFYFGLPIRFDVSGRGARNVDGPTDICLIASREKRGEDGWLRPGGTEAWPILERGRWGEWDCTQLYGPNSVLVVDDQIVLYYCAGAFGHEPEGSRSDAGGKNVYRTAIGRATLRLDGLISLRAGEDEVAITTRPLVFEGGRLEVNVCCGEGSLRVELLDEQGKVVPGFSRDDCKPFCGDELRFVVAWQNGSDLSTLAGKPVRVRFLLRSGDLYAFQFPRDSGS